MPGRVRGVYTSPLDPVGAGFAVAKGGRLPLPCIGTREGWGESRPGLVSSNLQQKNDNLHHNERARYPGQSYFDAEKS